MEIPRMVHNIGHAACVVVGMLKNDPELIGKGFSDIIIEKARSHLIEGYAHVRKSALDAGATGITLSGAGPTMIACVNPKTADANEVVKAMKEAFEQHNVPCEAFTGRPTFGSKEI